MGALFKNKDSQTLGYNGSFGRLVAEISEIVSKDDNSKLFLQLLKERVDLDYHIERQRILNGVEAIKDRREEALLINSWRSSAMAKASAGVLPFLKNGASASVPTKKRSLGVGSTPSGKKPEESWFNQFLEDWFEEEHGIRLPIAPRREEEDKLIMNGKETEKLTENKNSSKKRCFQGEERKKEMEKAKKQKVMNTKIIKFDKVPRELPRDLRKTIVEEKGGSEPVLVITKVLHKTDTSTHHGRLSIPMKQIINNFLTDEDEAGIDKCKSISVGLIEPCGEENKSVRLAKWEMKTKSNPVYNLISGWNSVVKNEKNGLEGMEGKAVLQLWSFRCDTKLWFALVKVPDEDQDDNGAILQGNSC